MYAGEEISLPLVASRETTLQLCARAVRAVWSNAVIQDATTAKVFVGLFRVPFSQLEEMMIYRDQQARRSWEELGADKSNRNSMVHFLFAKGRCLLVLDDRVSEESTRIIAAVESVLSDSMTLVPARSPREEAA